MSKVSILLAAAISLATGAYAVTVDLSSVTADTVLADGDVATGTLSGNYKISIAAGATVTLSNVTITNIVGGSDSLWAGLTCLGDAEIVLEGENVVKGRNDSSAGIYVPENRRLTISGSGSLTATGGRFYGAGIGGGFAQTGGYIVIDGGVITATGGASGAGIGSGGSNSSIYSTASACQDITINGGRVIATGGGAGAAGIGSGNDSECAYIEITGGTVTATGGEGAAGIGSGNGYSNGSVCGGIWISGGFVTATGGTSAAGIGTGTNGWCYGAIDIGPDISRVIATCGENCTNPIGAGVGDEYSDDPRVDNSLISTLSADGRTLTIVPDSYVEPPFTTGGDADWTDEGNGVWKSGAISDRQTTWAEVSVSGPCLVSFSWKTSSEGRWDKLHCYLDGVENLAAISGEMSTWDTVSFVVRGSGSHTVKFEYVKDSYGYAGDDCGWVKDFDVTSVTACTVTLDANGGTLDGNTVEVFEGCPVGELPMPTWSGDGSFVFTGWFTAASGGTQVTEATVINGDTTFYAHWEEYTPPAFTTGGDANWTLLPDGSWRSGTITSNQSTWIEFPVTGPCAISFSWKASSESIYDELYCYLDGEEALPAISGVMSDWDVIDSFVVRGSGPHTVKFEYIKDYEISEGNDCGWVKGFTVTQLTPCTVTLDPCGGTLAGNTVEAAEGYPVGELPVPTWSGAGTFAFAGWFTVASGGTQVTEDTVVNGDTTFYAHWIEFHPPTYTTGGDANWTMQPDGSWRSGTITSNQSTWIEFSVTGPCAVSFSWKTSSESGFDKLHCYLDGEEKLDAISGVMADWSDEMFPILESGEHKVRFTYIKDSAIDKGEDCGWVKDFTATPLVPRTVTLNAQGGTLSGNTILVLDGYAVGELPAPAWNGAGLKLFAGWFTSAEGGTRVTSETIADVGLTALYAHWDTSVNLFETGGDAFWTDEGGGVWRSGAITNRESTWVKIYVTAPCDVNFSWKTSSENFDKLHCYLDGAESLAPIGGEMSVWSNAAVRVQGSGAHEIMFTYVKDGVVSKGDDCAWVKDITVTPLTPCTVTLDPCGGTLVENEVDAIEGQPVGELPMPTWSGSGLIIFTGWFTAASGGTQVTEATVINGNTTFYAHWEEYTPPAFTTGGDANWTFQPDGSWRSGAITNKQSTWIEFPVTGPCEVSFLWKTSSESYDKLHCAVDGVAKLTPIGGEMPDWVNNTFMLQGGNHNVTFTFTNDYSTVKGQNCAWVKGFAVTPLTPCTVTLDANGGTLSGNTIEAFEGHPVGELPVPVRNGEIRYAFIGWFTSADGGAKVTAATVVNGNTTFYAHWEEYTPPAFTTGGDANWTLQTDGSWKSGEITHSQSNWIATAAFSGKGTISFQWKSSSETRYDKVVFYIDNVEKKNISGEQDWTTEYFSVATEGTHTLKWAYTKDSSTTKGEDCGWIDLVVWTPESSYGAWAAEKGVTEAWNVLDANGNAYVFRYAFNNPTGDFSDSPLLDITFNAAGKAVVKTPPLVNSEGYTFSVVASDNPDGTGHVETYDLQSSGETTINETGKTTRFFRLKVVEQ